MSAIVVCYSWTGNAYALAKAMGGLLGAEVFRLEECKPREGKSGFARGGAAAVFGLASRVKALPRLDSYDEVYLFSPLWAGGAPPAINTLLNQCDFSQKRVHVFCTLGGGKSKRFERKVDKKLSEAGATAAGFWRYPVPMSEKLDETRALSLMTEWKQAHSQG